MKRIAMSLVLGMLACRSKASTTLQDLTALKERLCACQDVACKAEVLALVDRFYADHAEVRGTGEQANQAAFVMTGISLCAKPAR